MQRRRFLEMAWASSLAACLPVTFAQTGKVRRSRRILVLGGTNFVGPAIVERAVERGHEVTLFNRGQTRPELFPECEKLRGVRRATGEEELSALQGQRRWDALIDVWPQQSALVRSTAQLLADRVDYAFFVSSIAVYADFRKPGLTEASAVHQDDPGWYGGEKVLAEQALRSAFSDRSGVARCHAILGPRDDGTAFHYWLRRIAEYDEVLAPGSGEDPVQWIDVRDVARWVVDCVEQERPGVHNLCGPERPTPFRDFLETCREALESSARLIWVDGDTLRRTHKIQSFSDMPLWAPLDEEPGFQQISAARALQAGLQLRPLQSTALDAWDWWDTEAFVRRQLLLPIDGD
jgi:2'-hydroxyisoflavone reductase